MQTFFIFTLYTRTLPSIRGDYAEGEWNEEYWKLKEKYVGVVPPVDRTTADLDPPTIFHIAQDYDMIRYRQIGFRLS